MESLATLIYSLPLLQIHLTAIFTTLAIVVVADAHGLLWLTGKIEKLPARRMYVLHTLTWIGVICIASAGISMFAGAFEYYLSLPAFRFKMLFIFGLVLNAFFIGKHIPIATTTAFKTLSKKEKTVLLISGAVSTFGWLGAYTCAQFLS
jgi:hypothetical protein